MALPNSNITTTMVGQELGLSTRNVGNLCRSTAINKWSKWKPVRHSKLFDLNESDFASVNFGLNIPFFSTRQELINYYESGQGTSWEYARPAGGELNPFRLGDFRNYEHSAFRFYDVLIPERVVGTGSVTIEMGSNTVPGGLIWTDFSALDLDYLHFGATASNNQTVIESDPIVEDNTGYVSIPVTQSITSYAFLALLSEIDPSVIQRYYALEGGSGYTEYLTSGINVDMTNTLMLAMNNVISNLTLNSVSGTILLTGVSIQVRYGDKNPTDSLENGEATHSFGNITVTEGTPQTRFQTFNNVLGDYATRGGYVYFQCVSHPQLNQYFGLNVS